MADGDALRARFAATAGRVAARADEEADALRERLRRLLHLRGDEHVLDVGTGAAALPVAVAPFVARVVGVDVVPELLAEGRRRAEGLANVELVEGDATALPFDAGSFDVGTCVRVLHHVRRPELVVAELTRVVRPGGRVLLADQLAPLDPLLAIDADRFERARDPSHQRLLPDSDVRFLLEMNGLVLERAEVRQERRELDPYLDLAGCEGADRERARGLAPGSPYRVEVGWYLARRPGQRR
ncbi:MAG TPA: methyltransferase domain-containing protein [Gaiellaceae bacterium]|jgi:SAM-dependent methyltransferase|nr:methyltransferase domain-containing protein [Gaiellaceae bacterium]